MLRRSLLISIFLFFTASAIAAPLEELQNSTEYKGAVRGAKRLKLPAWADPDSNYIKLFEGMNGKAKIFKLLGDDYEGFPVINSRLVKEDEYISATRIYGVYKSKTGISLSLVVPHPAYIHLIKEKLVMSFEALRPKPAEVLSSDPIKIDTDIGELVVCRDGSTVIILSLPMEARLIARAKSAKEAKEMAKLVELVNVGEIKRQLTS